MLLILELCHIWIKSNIIISLIFFCIFWIKVYITSRWSIKLNSCDIYYFPHKMYVYNWIATVYTLTQAWFYLSHLYIRFRLLFWHLLPKSFNFNSWLSIVGNFQHVIQIWNTLFNLKYVSTYQPKEKVF